MGDARWWQKEPRPLQTVDNNVKHSHIHPLRFGTGHRAEPEDGTAAQDGAVARRPGRVKEEQRLEVHSPCTGVQEVGLQATTGALAPARVLHVHTGPKDGLKHAEARD